MLCFASAVALASLFTQSLASPSHSNVSQLLSSREACSGNTASTRSAWGDYSIETDYTTTVPDTGVTREYYFELTDVTISPDGYERAAMAINGSVPGPTIYADWGDAVVVHVTNSLTTSTNGTSIHFHGIRQNYTNQNDGVTSITQCPTPPGSAMTYTWRALQYGSSWYHSHFALQAWQGIFGGIVINGPATADYDDDQIGFRWNTTWTEGTSYRLRLVNAAVDSHFKFSIDNHTMTVIATDLVSVVPSTTDIISIGMGQRYDAIITADQASVADSFWVRAIPQSACSENDNSDNIKGIIYYGSSTRTPSSTGYDFDDSCEDMDPSDLVPYHSQTVGDATWDDEEVAAVGFNDDSLFRWYLNSTTMVVAWDDPTLLQVQNNETAFATSDAVIEIEGEEWAYLAIQTTLSVPHPIHLHGHDFFVLAQGSGAYSGSSVGLALANPPRRDTALLPGSGHLVLAFRTDNPGAWLMHCHIGWHTSEGFALQFVERRAEMRSLIDLDVLESNCEAWASYQNSTSVEQDDSGI